MVIQRSQTISLDDLERSQTIFLTNKYPKDRFRIDSSNVRKTKCFGKETSKKNSWEKLLDR